jgi:hypothetical protein
MLHILHRNYDGEVEGKEKEKRIKDVENQSYPKGISDTVPTTVRELRECHWGSGPESNMENTAHATDRRNLY